ncbi:MAG: hypothetical protein U1F24_13145 [Alphaproteobacteria bacterium]|jgi:hypothetical protein
MRRLAMILAIAAAALAPAFAQAGKLSLRNDSGIAIVHVYVSPIDVDRFGPDLLRGGQIAPGDSFVLADLANGLYDMKLVDARGAECLLKDVDYFQYSIWTITANCGAFGGMGQ